MRILKLLTCCLDLATVVEITKMEDNEILIMTTYSKNPIRLWRPTDKREEEYNRIVEQWERYYARLTPTG